MTTKCTLTDKELVKRVGNLTDKMYKTRDIPPMCVPPRYNEDYDLLVPELLARFTKLKHQETPEGRITVDKERLEHVIGAAAHDMANRALVTKFPPIGKMHEAYQEELDKQVVAFMDYLQCEGE